MNPHAVQALLQQGQGLARLQKQDQHAAVRMIIKNICQAAWFAELRLIIQPVRSMIRSAITAEKEEHPL